jgi:hypothetical protein
MRAKILLTGNASNARQKAGAGVIKRFLAQSVWPYFLP